MSCAGGGRAYRMTPEVRLRGQSGHEILQRECPLMTRSGHCEPFQHWRELVRCPVRASGAAMRRRDFISLIGGAAVVWPLAGSAQQSGMPVIGFLSSRAPGDSTGVLAALYQGLREVGFVEGQNVQIAFRWAEGHYDRLPALAADLVGLPVAAIFAAGGQPSTFARRQKRPQFPSCFLQ